MTVREHTLPDGAAFLLVAGRLDVSSRSSFLQSVQACLSHGRLRLALDLSGLEGLDLCGVGALISALRETTHRGGELRITGLSAGAARVLRLTHLGWLLRATGFPA